MKRRTHDRAAGAQLERQRYGTLHRTAGRPHALRSAAENQFQQAKNAIPISSYSQARVEEVWSEEQEGGQARRPLRLHVQRGSAQQRQQHHKRRQQVVLRRVNRIAAKNRSRELSAACAGSFASS